MQRTSEAYIDEALELGMQELQALEGDDIELAATLAERRSWLLSQAWDARQECDTEAYKKRLLKMQDLQYLLTLMANKRHTTIREGLVRSRKESRRLAGYHQALAHNF